MANCYHIQIKDWTLTSHTFFINALIAKTEKKIMSLRRNNANVGVITFTIRDITEHIINCIVWGSEQFIDVYDRAYKIEHIIAVYHPTVSQKNKNSSYRPRTLLTKIELTKTDRLSIIL